MKEAIEVGSILALVVFCVVMLSGCQGLVNYMTDDAYPVRDTSTTFECRDVSPPQLDNVVIRCTER